MDNVEVVCAYELDELYRCAYRIVKSKQANVTPSEYLTDGVKEAIIKPGIEFEAELMSQFEWQKTTESLKELMDREVEVIKHPNITGTYIWRITHQRFREKIYEKIPVKLVGIPDMLIRNPFNSNFYTPVDIKHHGNITSIDIRRILFYSFILRTGLYAKNKDFLASSARNIHGYIWLPGKDSKDVTMIPVPVMNDWDYSQYYGLPLSEGSIKGDIKAIVRLHRLSKNVFFDNIEKSALQKAENPYDLHIKFTDKGLVPAQYKDECRKCKLRGECLPLISEYGGISIIREIGEKREEMFRSCGITTCQQLYECAECWQERPSLEKIESLLTQKHGKSWKAKYGIGSRYLEKIVYQAKAIRENETIIRERFHLPEVKTEFYVDMEYADFPFCIGVKIKNGEQESDFQRFMETESQAKAAIIEAKDLIDQYRDYTVYTWRGEDSKILGIPEYLDIYNVVDKCLSLPLSVYSVKDVAVYFGYKPQKLEISDGLHCVSKFSQYQRDKDESIRNQLKQEIINYNWNDVASLYYVVSHLKTCNQ